MRCDYCGIQTSECSSGLCDDCEHRFEPGIGKDWWQKVGRYQMHREMAEMNAKRLAATSAHAPEARGTDPKASSTDENGRSQKESDGIGDVDGGGGE